jgi:hypothetical protein
MMEDLDLLVHWTTLLVFLALLLSLVLLVALVWSRLRGENGITSVLAYREFSLLLLFAWSVLLLVGVFPSREFHLWVRLITLINYIVSVFVLIGVLVRLRVAK